ncbi:MAG: hypothetical protein CMF70_04520 [Magnetovibrio sp.]|nr:hypothetical protein [Magnetovibrio sp.]
MTPTTRYYGRETFKFYLRDKLKEKKVAVYRITRFKALDVEKAAEIGESMRDMLENIDSEFIDMVSYGNGDCVVVAKYPDQAAMDAATDTAKMAFGKMIEAGAVDGSSVKPETGEVLMSF